MIYIAGRGHPGIVLGAAPILYALYKEEGEKVWESFNKPKEVQKWYYTSMYDAVLMNATEENKLFERYKKILNKLF